MNGSTFVPGIDAWGNLTEITNSQAGCNSPTLSQGITTKNQFSTMFYDAAGNLTNDGSHPFTYDTENRLATAGGVTYTYDGDGKRVKKSNGTLYWTGPGWDPLLETDLSGNATAEYVFFNGERVARVDMPGNTPKYYFEDHLGSTDIVTNPTGGIVEESDYVPYGGEVVINGSDPNHFKFTGKERDPESLLDYFDARHYSSPFGRFMTPDWAAKPTDVPYANFGNPQSLNLYSYVQNNPTTVGDPDGHADPCGCDLLSPHQAYVIDQSVRFWASVTWQVLQQDAKVISGATHATVQAIQNSFSSDNSKTAPAPQSNPAPGTQTGTEAGSQPKDVYIDPSKYPASAGHAADAQAAGHPDVLTVDRPGSDARGDAALAGHGTQAGTDRDEYPPKVTQEGGKGASVRNIPSSDNRGAGASVGNQIRTVPNGGQIRIVPKPKPKVKKS